MRRTLSINKNKIKPTDIKANIYDTVKLIIDINGITSLDLNSIQELLKNLFPSEIYSLTETELYANEVSELNDRKPDGITIAAQKRLLEKESVLRFVSKDEREEFSISRLFVSAKLDYKVAHSLSKKIKLMSEIMECFSSFGYFDIERITLSKINSIVCISLYRLYQCFSKSMFGDTTYTLSRQGKNVKEICLKNENYFEYGENNINVSKIVQKGILNDNDKKSKVYEGMLNINACHECPEHYNGEIKTKIEELNSIIFEIFMSHITGAFAEDLVLGNTNKVIGGFNKNE